MSRPAVLAAALLACASLVPVAASPAGPGTPPGSPDPSCPAAVVRGPACGARAVEPADVDMLALADPAPGADTLDAGVAFKDAERIPASILATPSAGEGGKPLVPALAALVAMVVLLPRRPGAH